MVTCFLPTCWPARGPWRPAASLARALGGSGPGMGIDGPIKEAPRGEVSLSIHTKKRARHRRLSCSRHPPRDRLGRGVAASGSGCDPGRAAVSKRGMTPETPETTRPETPGTVSQDNPGQPRTTQDRTPGTPVATVASLAAELGTTPGTLRKWCQRRELMPASAPGHPARFTAEQADAVREGWDTRDRTPGTVSRVVSQSPGQFGTTRDRTTQDTAGTGWPEALAEARARADGAEATVAELRGALARAQRAADDAQRRAEGAEAALAGAERRLADLRVAWVRWYGAAASASLWRRLRGALPPVPDALADQPRLAAPETD